MNTKEQTEKAEIVLSVSEMPQENISVESGRSFLLHGDSYDWLKKIPENSMDSVVCDPPYMIGFMGKEFDNPVDNVAADKDFWKLVLRVLKPGGHLIAFSGTRTYHRMAGAIEDAGFEVRDMIEWVYGSGFPKSLNIGKAVKAFNETGGSSPRNLRKARMGEDYEPTGQEDYRKGRMFSSEIQNDNTKEEINNEWEGWGTALKPAHEPICMARKPLSEKSVAENCLKWGTGGINIDESRVGTEERFNAFAGNKDTGFTADDNRTDAGKGLYAGNKEGGTTVTGRFPANLLHDNSEEVRECFPETGKSTGGRIGNKGSALNMMGENYKAGDPGFGDSGSASRFFKSIIYQAKSSKSERNKGCEGMPEKRPDERTETGMGTFEEKGVAKQSNFHPTVKPIALMEYLIKMVTKAGGIVLDPFAGSGSTLVAAKQNGYQYVGIELTAEYIPIIEARLKSPISQKLF